MHHQRCYKVLALATIFENITQVKLIISNPVHTYYVFKFDRKRNKKKQFKFENGIFAKKMTIKVSIKSNNWDVETYRNKLEKI